MKTETGAFLVCILSILLMAGAASRACGAEANETPLRIEVTGDAGVNADIENRTLDEALRTMAGKGLFEIRGAVPPGVAVTVHFSHLTLDEALKKLMRGYNYVLVDQGASRAPLLMLMGKIERGGSAQQAVASPAPPRPLAAAPQPAPPAPNQPPPGEAPAPPRPMSPPGLQTPGPGGAPGVEAGPVLPPGERVETGEGQGGGAAARPEAPLVESQPQPPPQPQQPQPPAQPQGSPGISF